MFGSFVVYVATKAVCRYLERVLVVDDPPAFCAVRGQRLACSASCAEMMVVVQEGAAGQQADEDLDGNPRQTQSAKNPI